MSVVEDLQGEQAVRKWNLEEKRVLTVKIRRGFREEVLSELHLKDH